MKQLNFIVLILLMLTISCGKDNDDLKEMEINFEKPGYTYVPDSLFEKALIRMGYDTIIDGYVTTANIDTISWLFVDAKNISDLTGIEDFSALTVLSCTNNHLTSLDVSKNTALTILQCGRNQLTSLDVSKNTALKILNCNQCQITSLDLANNILLGEVACMENPLSNLDVSKNTSLVQIACSQTQLTSLDVSKNIALTSLYCPNSQITSLNLKNGNNKSLRVEAKYNKLSCVEVDDPAWSNEYWKDDFDANTSFSTNCE